MSVEPWRSGCETRSVARSRMYSSSRFTGASFGAECERNSSALQRVPRPPSGASKYRPPPRYSSWIGRGGEDQADLFLAPEQAVGEQLAEQEVRSRLVGAAVVHAHHAVDGRKVRLHHELEGVAQPGIAARGGRDRPGPRSAACAQRSGTSSLRSGRALSRRAPIRSSASRNLPPSPSKTTLVICASCSCRRSTPRPASVSSSAISGFT